MSDSTTEAPTGPSLHHQRRWYYVLWSSLLALSLVAYGFWLWPVAAGQGAMAFHFGMDGAPGPVTLSYWVGRGGDALGQGGSYQAVPGLETPKIPIAILQRRWVRDLHPKAPRLVLLRFQSGGQSRFALYDMKEDLRAGVLKDHRLVGIRAQLTWDALSDSESAPTKLS